MSQPGLLKKEGLATPSERDDSQNRSSRRRFMRDALVSAVGASVVIGDPGNLLAWQTDMHVDDFLIRAKRARLTGESTQEFQRFAESILQVVKEDSRSRSNFDQTKSWLLKQRVSTPLNQRHSELGISEDVTAAGAVSFLRALPELQRSKSRGGSDWVRALVANSVRKLDNVETDFVDRLIARTKRERQNDPTFAQKIDNATRALSQVSSHLSKVGHVGSPKSGSDLHAFMKVDRAHLSFITSRAQQASRCAGNSLCEFCTSSQAMEGLCIAVTIVWIVISVGKGIAADG